jgi:hypothetical protein
MNFLKKVMSIFGIRDATSPVKHFFLEKVDRRAKEGLHYFSTKKIGINFFNSLKMITGGGNIAESFMANWHIKRYWALSAIWKQK